MRSRPTLGTLRDKRGTVTGDENEQQVRCEESQGNVESWKVQGKPWLCSVMDTTVTPMYQTLLCVQLGVTEN